MSPSQISPEARGIAHLPVDPTQTAGERQGTDKASHGCPTVGCGTQAKPPSPAAQYEASSHGGPAPQVSSVQVLVPETPRQVVPAAQSMLPVVLSAQGWPAPGMGVQTPKVLTSEPLRHRRSPAQPTTGLANRLQGCPCDAYTIVAASVQSPVAR